VDRVIQILCRRTKNNPVLIASRALEKTAIVEGLAQRIADADVRLSCRQAVFFPLDLSLIVAGTNIADSLEERLKTIMKEDGESELIVSSRKLHTLVGAGSAKVRSDAANI